MYDLKSWMHDWLRLQKGYVPITIMKGFKTAILMLFIITSKLDPFFGRCYSSQATHSCERAVWDLLG